jgi:hypothetical protein
MGGVPRELPPPSFMLLVVVAAAALVGCSSEGQPHDSRTDTENGNGRSQVTIVFVDPSTQHEARATFADSLRRIARERIENKGDRIKAYQVRKRTEIKTPHVTIRNRIDPPEESEFVDRQMMREARARTQQDELEKRADSTLQAFLQNVEIESRPSSDLYGALEVILEEKGKGAPTVYFFSDMYHAGSESIRDFEYKAPTSRREAQQWAQKDAQVVGEQLVNSWQNAEEKSKSGNLLSPSTEIRMVPGEAARRERSPYVETYWKTFFAEVGAHPSHISFN